MGVTFDKLIYMSIIASLLFQILFCSTPEYAGGVETTNGITIAFKQNRLRGTAPAGSRIVLCDTSYIEYISFEPFTKIFIDTTFANDAGAFQFDSLPDGFYNLTARNGNADSGAIITNISINHLNSKEIQKSSPYEVLGSITGTVCIDSETVSFALAYVMGTDLCDTTDAQGKYTIENVPPGQHKIVGSYGIIFKDSVEYYVLIKENVTMTETVPTTDVNLNLERIK